MNVTEFKKWLEINTKYSKRVISNTVSRLVRANRILPIYEEEIYLFELERKDEFKALSVTVRSQIRKSVKLYLEYIDSKNSRVGEKI